MSGSVDDELQEVKQRLQATSSSSKQSCDDLRLFCKLSREAKLRNAADVAKFGSALLHYQNRLPEDECWQLHEQVSIALLECGSPAAALPLVKAVLIKFPPADSIRARRLQGLYYEAAGKPERAKELYESTLQEQPHDTVMPKRLAGLHRGLGELAAAIDVLRHYLDHFSNDREAWEELADCYLEACQYQQAAFCLEEVLSTAPLAPLTLIKYADVLATLGSPSQLKAARAYYSQALRVSAGRSVRALFGIVFVDNQLSDKDNAGSSAAAQELPGACAATLLRLYEQQAPPQLLPAAKQALRKQLGSLG